MTATPATKFKETEIGPIPKEWDILPLAEMANSISDTFKFNDELVIFLNTGDILEGKVLHSNKSNPKLLPGQAKKRIQKDDILFTEIRPANKRFAFVDFDCEDYVVSTKLMVLRAKEGVFPQFLYILLTSHDTLNNFQALAESRSGTFPQITFDAIGSQLFPLPKITEQKKIVEILSALDEKIELNRRINANLEGLASALFKKWFIDFDFPDKSGEPYNSSGGKMADSELGEIPATWNIGTLGEIAENQRRGIKPEEMNSSMPYIALEHMPRRSIALTAWDYAQELGSNKSLFKRGDFLFGKLRPYFHKVGIAPVDGVCSTDILVITPRKQEWYGFVLCHIASVDFVNYTSAGSTGTKMPRTNWNDMSRYEVVLPPSLIAKQFTELTQPLFQQLIINVHESNELADLRDSILPRLMSGKIRV